MANTATGLDGGQAVGELQIDRLTEFLRPLLDLSGPLEATLLTGGRMRGGLGLSGDIPLASLRAQAPIIQIAEDPDQVHLQSIAEAELTHDPVLRLP